MLAEAQDALIELIKNSPLAKKLRTVDVLPTVATQMLFQKFMADAPGIFVDAGGFGENSGNRTVTVEMGILLIAKNARGAKAAQQGDGMMIGLLEMADAAAAMIEGAVAGCITWKVVRAMPLDNFEDRVFVNQGLIAMSMKVTGRTKLDSAVDESALSQFQTMAVDIDVEPFASKEVHEGWLQEPKDTSGGTPDAQSIIQLEQ